MGVFDKVKSKLGFDSGDEWDNGYAYENQGGEEFNPFAEDAQEERPDRSARDYRNQDRFARPEANREFNNGLDYSGRKNDISPVHLVTRPGYGGYRDTSNIEYSLDDYHYVGGPTPDPRPARESRDAAFDPYADAPRTERRNTLTPTYAREDQKFDAYGDRRYEKENFSQATTPFDNSLEDRGSEELYEPTNAIGTPTSRETGYSNLVVVAPKSYDEIQVIANSIKNGKAIALDLTKTRPELAVRILDFSFGITCGLEGGVQQMKERVYLLTTPRARLVQEDKSRLVSAGLVGEVR